MLVIQIRITYNYYFYPLQNIQTLLSLSPSPCFQYELLHYWIDLRIRYTNKKNGALEFVIQQQTMTMLQPLTVAWTLQLFLPNHPVKYARYANASVETDSK